MIKFVSNFGNILTVHYFFSWQTRYDFIDYFKTSEYKVKVVKPSSPESENGFLERILDIDGEAVEIKHPEYSVK